MWNKAGLGLVEDEVVFEEAARNHGVSAIEIKSWLLSRREPNKELIELLSRLKDGIKIAILNNGLKTLFYQYLQNSVIPIELHVLINSAEKGVKKPDPKIYEITCAELGVSFEECVFVDDSQENIEGAKELGMEGILFTSIDKLRTMFDELNILKTE